MDKGTQTKVPEKSKARVIEDNGTTRGGRLLGFIKDPLEILNIKNR